MAAPYPTTHPRSHRRPPARVPADPVERFDGAVTSISSEELADSPASTPPRSARTSATSGSYGTRGVGYEVEYLVYQIRRELGLDPRLAGRHRRRRQPRPGARRLQRLRRARVSRSGASSTSIRPRSAPSSAVSGSATSTNSPRWCSANISIGVDRHARPPPRRGRPHSSKAGITSILNFAPTVLSVPAGISVRKVDLAVELQILSYTSSGGRRRPVRATSRRSRRARRGRDA
jgi:redox-sensing transcriptional repressor